MELRKLRQSTGSSSVSLLYLEAAQYVLAAEHGIIPSYLAEPLYCLARSYRAELFLKPTDVHAPQVLLFASTFVALNETCSDSLNPPTGEMATLALRSSKAAGLQGKISRVLAAIYIAAGHLTDDQGYFVKFASLELPTMAELIALQAQVETAKLTAPQMAGCMGVILRCRAWVLFQRCINACTEAEEEDEPMRLAAVDDARATWTSDGLALDAERTALLQSAPSLLSWLELEHTALDLVLSGVSLHFSLGCGFSPQFFHDVIKKEAGSVQLQAFIQIHGPTHAETSECVLAATSNLPRGELYPTTLTCAYTLRAFVTSLEVHAGCLKLWGIPPPREAVWKSVMRGAAETLRQLKGGGMAVCIANAVATAARDTIPRWKLQLANRPHRPQPPPRPSLCAGTDTKPHLSPSENGVANGGSDNPLVSSFAEWIAGIDWNQFAKDAAAVTPVSMASASVSGGSTSGSVRY